MPEQLKPCPACGSDNVQCLACTIYADENQDVHFHIACEACYTSGPIGDNGEMAADKWNSLPRRPDYNDVDCAGCPERRRSALTWTTEPPKVPGIFLAESTLDNCSKKITPIEVFSSDHWRHSDWEKRHGKLSCLLCLGGFGVCPVSKYSRFAGPIPEPLEPEGS